MWLRLPLILLCVTVMARGESPSRLSSKALPDLPDAIGMAGPFVGVHRDALIVAGGANFPVPEGEDLWEVPKIYHADAWVLTRTGEGYAWKAFQAYPSPVRVSTQASAW